MTTGRCVIVGASHAGVSLALQLRREGWTGPIQLVGAETALPYHRPPLSKDLLAGTKTPESISLRPAKVYADNGIELLLGRRVDSLNRSTRSVFLDDGSSLPYDKLALCTGAVVRPLPQAREQENVCYVRTLSDSVRLAGYLQPGKRAVIVGAGYIGLEVAAQMAQRGMSVTVLEMAGRILNRVAAPVVADHFSALHRAHGVVIRTGVSVVALEGSPRVERVVCSDGSSVDADVVVVGIGITPDITLAQKAGLHTEDGIVVDEYTRTSDALIHAAGDCAQHPSRLYGRMHRLESVQNANDQARVAAANLCDKQVIYDAVPWFWSDQYASKLQTAGVNLGYDDVICRGDPSAIDGAGFAAFYCQQGRVLAVDCVNRPKEFMLGKQLVAAGAHIEAAVLANEVIDLAAYLP